MSWHSAGKEPSRREVLALPFVLSAAPSLSSAAQPSDWLGATYRELHLDAHFGQVPAPYRNFQSEAAAAMLKDAGFGMVSCFASCGAGYSYYPSKFGVSHPGLQRDYTGEMTAALKKRGVRVLAYISVGPDRRYHKDHPEWAMVRNPPTPAGEMAMMCLSSPWVEQVHIPQMRELVANYNVDGFFLDNLLSRLTRGPCYCRYCRESFAAETGGDIPTLENDPRAFQVHRWLTSGMARYADKVTQSFADAKPELAFVFTHVWVSRNPVKPPASVVQLVWEPAPPYTGVLSLDFSFESRYLSTQSGITNWSCMATRGDGWGDYSLRDPAAFSHESAVLLANGGRPYLSDDSYPSGNPEPFVYQVYGAVNKRTRELEPIVKGCIPVRDVAVLLSAQSIWANLPLTPPRDWMSRPSSAAVAGAHTALVESHVQFSILNSESLISTLQDYKALLLPEQCVLSDEECGAIRSFVRGGGALVASGDTGTRDVHNQSQRNFLLADILGIRLRGHSDSRRSFLRANDHAEASGLPAMDIQVNGPSCLVDTTTARVLMGLVAAAAKQSPSDSANGAGVTLNEFGAGRAVYCAAPIFSAYLLDGTPVLRKLAAWMVELVHPAASRSIVLKNAPVNLEVVYNRRGKDRFIHLVNFSGDRRLYGPQRVQDETEVRGIEVRLQCPQRPRRLLRVPENRETVFQWSGNWLSFNAGPVSTHTVWMVEG